MSRSLNDSLAVGVGTCDVAIGTRCRSWPKWAAYERVAGTIHRIARGRADPGAAIRDEPLGERTPADVAAPPHQIREIDTARRYTEDGALEALGLVLADTKSASSVKRRASVALDDFWGRHAILQGDFRGLRAKEIDEVAAAYFADTFGVDGNTLSIRWQVQPAGRALFASALPSTLIDGIRAVGEAARLEIASVTLGLPQMLNRVRSAISSRSGLIFVATDTLLHAVTIGNRGWAAYDTERLFHRSADDAVMVADAARQIFERSAGSRQSRSDIFLCGLLLDPAPFERSFARICALPAYMSDAAPALTLMELAS